MKMGGWTSAKCKFTEVRTVFSFNVQILAGSGLFDRAMGEHLSVQVTRSCIAALYSFSYQS